MGNDIGAMQSYQQSVLDAIDTVVQRRINGLKLDKTVVAIIDKNVGSLNGYPLYQVKYEGGTFVATARDSSESYMRNTAVYVMIPQSDFSKEKFIIGRASSISSTSAESASISAAINNYVKLGPNLITNNSSYGLRSYHDPIEEESDPDSILHRARYLYNINKDLNATDNITVSQNLFKTYAGDATNILLRADFRTNLDVIQQHTATGRYGLAVTLTFTNPNAGYGETQGEILNNLGGIIKGRAQKITVKDEDKDAYIIDTKTNTSVPAEGWVGEESLDDISLKDWDKRLQYFFNSKDADDDKVKIWQKDGVGLFDCYTQYIQTTYQTFCVNNAQLKTSMTDNLVAAYLILLSDLKKAPQQSLAEVQQIYKNWCDTSIGDLSDVDEIVYLTSDSMLGNPFGYKNWNSQYVIPSQQFDFSRFKEVKSILFFKDGFDQNSEQEQIWPPSDAPKNGGKGWDIFCQNIQLFLLKDLDSEYQGFSLKVECANGYDGVLTTLSSAEKTAFNAHVYRNQTEDLTSNANIQYVWLKQSSQVINAKHADYYHYAGVGWKRLKNTNRFFFQTTGNENWAYKNLYKCIALYQTPTETIPLSTNFIVYNNAVSTKVKLESDLGTEFTFSEGAPTISCLIQEEPLSGKVGEEAENYQEYGYSEENPLYKYQWSIADSSNASVLFLTEAFADDTSNIFKDNIVSKMKLWYLDRKTGEICETKDPTRATRIQYPVSLSSSGFTVECIVQKNFISDIVTNAGNYYDVGNDSIEITNLKMASSSSYRIIIENGDQVFQYDEYGGSPTDSKLKNPLTIKPLQAKIVGPTGLEFSGENANIEWIFNLENSMIVPPENLILNPATQQEQLLKGATCTFDIKKLYDSSAQNNQITCHANFNNIDIYAETKFFFGKVGSNGTNGTDKVSKISYEGHDRYFTLNLQPLTLYVQKDVLVDEICESQAMFNNVPDADGEINVLKNQQTITADNVLKVHLYQKNEEIDSVNFKQGYPRWNIAGNASGTSNNIGRYFRIEKEEQKTKIVWDGKYQLEKPLFQNIRSEIKIDPEETYYSFFSLPIIEYEQNDNVPSVDNLLPMQRIAIDRESYLVDVVYNADGRNPIYNHNQGLKLINLPENFTISWKACGGLDNNHPCFTIIDSNQKSINKDEDTEIDQVYILPDDVYSGSTTNNHIKAVIKQDNNIIATVYAPINMILNTFGLASLNAWDGNKVDINEEGGYVMAPQIGAGEKDDNNRFTGILMGKTETYTGGAENEKEVGLFGYAHGIQSIFLDSKTGNAIFGLPDGYELLEDGNIAIKPDDYNEGRIELRPGNVSKIGGWRLGRRGLYYVVDENGEPTEISDHYQIDYIPNAKTGKFEKRVNSDNSNYLSSPYSTHHEKDINYAHSGILLHSGTNPYISIKGRKLKDEDISPSDLNYIRSGDSLELQLDPMAPTLFSIFRHNGTPWTQLEQNKESGAIETVTKYEEGSRTFLAGINGKGEFVANTVNSIIIDDSNDVYTTQLSVNSLRAFSDYYNPVTKKEMPGHTGLKIKLGSNILGQIFVKNNGLNADADEEDGKYNPTLYITGGLTNQNGEYARPLSLHGRRVSLFAKGSNSDQNFGPITDSNLSLETNKFEINLGDNNTTLKLFRDSSDKVLNNLMTAGDFKLNAGVQGEGQPEEYIYYLDDNGNTGKINKRNNPTVYLTFEDSGGNIVYLIDGSWTSTLYYNIGTATSAYYVSQENYPICYRIINKTNYYCTREDYETPYYKIINLPSTIEDSYTYLDEEYIKQNRYKKVNNEYQKVSEEESYNSNQYVQFPKKEELNEDIDQFYIYIPKTNLITDKLYGFYTIDNENRYVYLSDDENLYNKIGNEYKKASDFVLETKFIDTTNGTYYNEDAVDLNSIYYRYEYNNNFYYVLSEILDVKYVKNFIEETVPIVDSEGNIVYDEETGEIKTETQMVDIGYRSYDESTDSEEEIYFYNNDNYIPLSYIQSNEEHKAVEYIAINEDESESLHYLIKSNLELRYFIGEDSVSEDDYNEALNNLYYKVADKNNNIYYIPTSDFSTDKFIYYYCTTLINNSYYINEMMLNNLDILYRYDSETNLYKQDDNGDLYQTFIRDPNAKIYEYISITTQENPSGNNAYINTNAKNIYISNSLYEDNWILKSLLSWPDPNDEDANKFLYYFDKDNNLQVTQLNDSIVAYYAVRDVENKLHYVLSDYLDTYNNNDNNKKYIFINGKYKEITGKPKDEEDSITLISKKQYQLYAGSYYSKITTNELSDKYISLEGNQEGINFFNSSGPISMFSEDNFFKLKLNSGGELSFGDQSTKFKDEFILAKFTKDNFDNGLSLTNTWLRLKSSSKTQIDSSNYFELISATQGNGPVYNVDNPQIVLRAGSEKSITIGSTTTASGAAAELILNSSNNAWKGSNIKNKTLEKRMSWPVFAVRTNYSGIGIYPEIFNANGIDLYREVFYVRMGQYNSMGLSIQGTIPGSDSKKNLGLNVAESAIINGKVTTNTGFKGKGKEVTHTTNNSDGSINPSGGTSSAVGLGTTISINTLSVSISNGRPTFGTKSVSFTYKKPTASDIAYKKTTVAAELGSLATAISNLNSKIAALNTSLNSKADKSHSHDFKYTTFTFKDKDGGKHTAVSRMSDSVGDGSVTIK